MVRASLYAIDNPRLGVTITHVKKDPNTPRDYYRLKLGDIRSDLTIFLSRDQLVSIHDAIRAAYEPAESTESYEAIEALQRYRIPAMKPVTARVNVPTELVLATEDEIERARR